MTSISTGTKFAVLLVAISLGPGPTAAAQSANPAPANNTAELASTAFSHTLPRMDGSHLKVTILEVTYGPGESSPPHSHPCAVMGYVIRGVLRTQVKGEAEAVYRAGQSFYEPPNGVHMISANASSKVPVKFLAYFVCDRDMPLTVAPPVASENGDQP